MGQIDWPDFQLALAEYQFCILQQPEVGPKRLRRSLIAFVSQTTQLKKKQVKCWLKPILGELRINDRRLDQDFESFDFEGVVELARSHAELKSSFQQELETEKLKSIKQLAYGASHEINNPLANIATRAQTLLVDERNPERRRKLGSIYVQSMRAHEMISDMMLFAHPPQPKFDACDIYQVCQNVIRDNRSVFSETKKIRFNLRRYPNVPEIECDKTQIAEVFAALLRNSCESIMDSGRIDVKIWPRDEANICLSITDDGEGISDEIRVHMFDPYYSGREAGRGLGFGLSKSWTIVTQLHAGQIDVRTLNDGRTEIQILLPMKQSAARADDSIHSNTSTPTVKDCANNHAA